MRRVPLDRRAQELRSRRTIASPPPGPRSASAARPATARARGTSPGRASVKAGGPSAKPKTQPWACWFASTSGGIVSGRSIPAQGTRPTPSPLRRCARRSRPAGSVTRVGARSRRIGSRADGCRTRIGSRRSRRGLYHADGQMLDEVYNYGSFKQSKMFAAGVTCSDCHEPHGASAAASGRRRLPAMPCVRQVRGRDASPPRGRQSAARLRVVPHAGAHLHGDRPPARSQPAHPAARSLGKARHAECLHRLPCRQVGGLGGGGR